ncbi:hypothetical protein H0H93_014914 [Arthromyces matolae]|nr:hypothetical protein H0H93_014914 [Arthromyces matolae]
MKSKTVASILRHVASKLVPTHDGEVAAVSTGELAALTPSQPSEKESKKERRARKAAGEDVGLVEQADLPIGGPNEEERLEKLYDTIAWPLGKKYGHPYDAFKLALTEPDTVFSSLETPIAPTTLSLLLATIARRLTPQPIKLRADIEVTCYTPAGIDAIKKALRAGENVSTEAVPIKAKLVAPPLYVLSTNATDKYAAVDKLEKAIEIIQSTIEDQGGNLVVKMKPKAVSETEEQDLAQLMAKAGQENAEVSGDEDEEE